MKKLLFAGALALALPGCAMLPALMGTPPTSAALQSTSIDEAAIDFARDSFDAALFGVDALMDLGKITEGSPKARNLAKLIRQIAGFLGAADAAQKAGQAATYNEAFRNAKAALGQFRDAIGVPAETSMAVDPVERAVRLSGFNLDDAQRLAIASQLDGAAAAN